MSKNKVLRDLAKLVIQEEAKIIEQNQLDLLAASTLDDTLVDRLKVDAKKVAAMVSAIEEVIAIEDPENKLLTSYQHPNGMLVENRVVPFGKILIIYESRPDVTIEAAISAFKAGNKIYLKGGKEAKNTNLFLVDLWHQALQQNGMDITYVTYLDLPRAATQQLIQENPYRIDLIIPRGGEGLINFIRANTSIPLLVSGRGNNFVYIHEDADFQMAKNIILNGKKRLSVCNATDKVLFNRSISAIEGKIKVIVQGLEEMGITVYGTADICQLMPSIVLMQNEELFYEEFLAPKILLTYVDGIEEAIEMINQYSGGHTAVIVANDKKSANQFQRQVDCAAVMHNTSSRFTDGGQFGFGAEIAISTQKLHFRGPVGIAQLVTNKWLVSGDGQIRE